MINENNEEEFNERFEPDIIGVKSIMIYKVNPNDIADKIYF